MKDKIEARIKELEGIYKQTEANLIAINGALGELRELLNPKEDVPVKPKK